MKNIQVEIDIRIQETESTVNESHCCYEKMEELIKALIKCIKLIEGYDLEDLAKCHCSPILNFSWQLHNHASTSDTV